MVRQAWYIRPDRHRGGYEADVLWIQLSTNQSGSSPKSGTTLSVVTLVLESRICHFVKWQIRPSNDKVTICIRYAYLTSVAMCPVAAPFYHVDECTDWFPCLRYAARLNADLCFWRSHSVWFLRLSHAFAARKFPCDVIIWCCSRRILGDLLTL